jgi:hypothetical protein
MSPHQSYGPPTYEFHPEFGYLYPSRQLRQNVRVGLAAAAFGLITGLAGAMALLPRHGASAALTTPVLAVAPSAPASDLAPLPASGPSLALAGAPSGTAARVSTDHPDKQLAPATPITRAAEAADEPSAAVQAPAAPAGTTVRGMATVSGLEHPRAETNKRTRRAKATARPRGRDTDALAASPFSFETRRFSDDTRSARRRDWGSSWPW